MCVCVCVRERERERENIQDTLSFLLMSFLHTTQVAMGVHYNVYMCF